MFHDKWQTLTQTTSSLYQPPVVHCEDQQSDFWQVVSPKHFIVLPTRVAVKEKNRKRWNFNKDLICALGYMRIYHVFWRLQTKILETKNQSRNKHWRLFYDQMVWGFEVQGNKCILCNFCWESTILSYKIGLLKYQFSFTQAVIESWAKLPITPSP